MNGSSKIECRLKKIIERSYKKNEYEVVLAAIAALAHIYYEKNQFYSDNFLEEYLMNIGSKIGFVSLKREEQNLETVLFYDSFTQDTRGLALIYLKALCKLGKKVVHITRERRKGQRVNIDAILREYNAISEYIPEELGHLERAELLNGLIMKYKPSSILIYATPYDVASVLVFNQQHYINRIQINLTDHAFWIGRNMFDYCIEFRSYGASVSNKYRGVTREKLILLPYYPNIYECEFEGLPFDTAERKMIFSGGALYKTFSEDNLYYMIIDEILEKHKEVFFLYLGDGNTKKLCELEKKYPERVYWSSERKDFYKIMEKCYFYLNTYPLAGGLMTQYAVAAGKLPITLMSYQDSEVYFQDKIGTFYETKEAMLEDINRIITDQAYKKMKEQILSECLIDEERFTRELNKVLYGQKTSFEIVFSDVNVEKLHQDYLSRFSKDKYVEAIAKRVNRALTRYFPALFLKRMVLIFKKNERTSKDAGN